MFKVYIYIVYVPAVTRRRQDPTGWTRGPCIPLRPQGSPYPLHLNPEGRDGRGRCWTYGETSVYGTRRTVHTLSTLCAHTSDPSTHGRTRTSVHTPVVSPECLGGPRGATPRPELMDTSFRGSLPFVPSLTNTIPGGTPRAIPVQYPHSRGRSQQPYSPDPRVYSKATDSRADPRGPFPYDAWVHPR